MIILSVDLIFTFTSTYSYAVFQAIEYGFLKY